MTNTRQSLIHLLLIYCLSLFQSKAEVKKESGESSPAEAACLCSPPARNQCASCGMEIQDRYLLKVGGEMEAPATLTSKKKNIRLLLLLSAVDLLFKVYSLHKIFQIKANVLGISYSPIFKKKNG